MILLLELNRICLKTNRVFFGRIYPFSQTSAGPDFKIINETRDISILLTSLLKRLLYYNILL